jgi:transcription elongation factor Elf1
MAPYDKNMLGEIADQEDEENKKSGRSLGVKRKFDEFECPTCQANNPYDDFGNNDEVICGWCGVQFTVLVDDEGNLKLKEA